MIYRRTGRLYLCHRGPWHRLGRLRDHRGHPEYRWTSLRLLILPSTVGFSKHHRIFLDATPLPAAMPRCLYL